MNKNNVIDATEIFKTVRENIAAMKSFKEAEEKHKKVVKDDKTRKHV